MTIRYIQYVPKGKKGEIDENILPKKSLLSLKVSKLNMCCLVATH